LTERTRAVLVNSPCNPTGGVLGAEDLRRIVEACARRGIFFIADETYERFVYDGEGHASAAALAAEFPDTVIVISSFSKTYAMTGWRIGYCIGPAEVIQAVTDIQSHATSNPTSFAMAGALAALRGAEGDVEKMIAEYTARRELLVPRLNALPGFSCQPPAGAFYVFPRVVDAFAPGREGSVAFSEFLLKEARVAVVPGSAFGDDQYIRLSFAASRQALAEGVDRIAAALGG
jgi:aspartate aminotransferase